VRAEALKKAARARLDTDFNWENIARQTLDVYERVWSEFLSSYWADKSLWPVKPGADERAAKLRVRDKALTGAFVARPESSASIPSIPASADAAIAAGESEEEERE
jgi:hypothetical protein